MKLTGPVRKFFHNLFPTSGLCPIPLRLLADGPFLQEIHRVVCASVHHPISPNFRILGKKWLKAKKKG
jgi:hypothetical protein